MRCLLRLPEGRMNFEPKHAVTVDFETYYGGDYTLSKMTTADYIRDDRFEVIGVGIQINNEAPLWISPGDFKKAAKEFPWHESAVLAHHTHFDGLILAHHYNVHPGAWLDTLSMARALHGPIVGGSLGKLMPYYQVGEKGDEAVNAIGKRFGDFTPAEWVKYGEYCKNDVRGCKAIFEKMMQNGFPEKELWVIDTTIRMFTEPKFVLDEPLLREFLKDESVRKSELLDRVGADKSTLMSNDKFAAVLSPFVEPPTKPSPAHPETLIWAFAKSDNGMQELLDHEDDAVRFLAEARIAVKSTGAETRTERFLKSGVGGRKVPVYLKYGAAHTFRWGGGDSMNFQNLHRGGVLRKSLRAPPGHKVVVADSAQIEARVLAWLAGQSELVAAFAENRDVYSEFASEVYGRPVDRKKNEADKVPGFVGKVAILGLGYGMGWYKFAETLLKGALGGPPVVFGSDMPAGEMTDADWVKVEDMPSRVPLKERAVHCAAAKAMVQKYRRVNSRIPALWKACEAVIQCMADGVPCQVGPCQTVRHGLLLPSWLVMRYPGLEQSSDGSGWSYLGEHKARKKLYGGLFVENVVQALARQVVAAQMMTMRETFPDDNPATMSHDELVYVVHESKQDVFLAALLRNMKRAPEWAAGLPLNAEGGMGETYGDAK